MQCTYPINPHNAEVLLKVKVSTPGEASTIVWKIKDTNPEEVAANAPNDPTGQIPKVKIGDSSLAGFDISVETNIDLELIDKTLREAAFKNLVIEYTFYGGTQGKQQFDIDDDDKKRDDTKTFITAVKTIRITKAKE